jgi:hypothetical protein
MVSSQSTPSRRPSPAFSSPSAFSISALKIAPCRRPSQQKGPSYCQLSAVSCQPLFSFSPSATAACVSAFNSFPPGCHPERNEGSSFRLPPLCVLSVSAFNSPDASSFDFRLSTFNCFSPKSRRIHTYVKYARKSFRIRTSRTKNLKSFRIRTYEKRPGGGGLIVNYKSGQGFVSRTTIGSEGSRRSPGLSIRLTSPFSSRRSTATLMDPGVRWTFGPIVFTGSGPLCRSASSTRKSVSEMPVSWIPLYR